MSPIRIIASAVLGLVFLLAPRHAIAWQPPGGTPVCDTTGNQTEPLAIADGAGGAIIGWNDTRSKANIFAERLRPDGVHEWTSNGVVVCTEPSAQFLEGIATDGAGGAIFVWRDLRNDSFGDLLAQRLRAGGTAAWPSGGVPVSLAPSIVQSGSVITSDGVGGCIIAWMDNRSQDNDVYAQRLDASGNRLWDTTGVALCVANNSQDNLAVVGDGFGGAIVSWIDSRSGGAKVYAQRINGNGFPLWTSNGVRLSPFAVNQSAPRVVSDGTGGAIVVWDDIRLGAAHLYARRIDSEGNAMWDTSGVQLGATAGPQQNPTAVTDGHGGAIVAWNESQDVYAQRVDSGGTLQWGLNGYPVCDASGQQFEPVATSDGNSGAIISWIDVRSGTALYAQRVGPGGAELWTNDGVMVCGSPASPYNATIVPDGSGGAIVVWEDDRGPTDVYAMRVGDDGTIGPGQTPAWQIDGSPMSTRSGVQQNPRAVADGEGGALIAWEDYGTPSPDPGSSPLEVVAGPLSPQGPGHARIRTIRVTDAGDAAGGFPDGGNQITTVGSDQVEPATVSDEQSGVIVAWKDNRNSQFDIYAQRVLGDGTIAPGWGASGRPVCIAAGAQERPVAISDDAGGAIVCWEDRRGGTNLDIYTVRITADGFPAAGWTTNGISICTASGDQTSPVLAPDGQGGAWIAWVDSRALPSQIYLQHVTATGGTLLAANGLAAATVNATQVEPAIAGDGVGGAFIVWTDSRLDVGDIYGQHSSADDSLTWGSAGQPMCNASARQGRPAIISNLASTVILIWEDRRTFATNATDLYATSRAIDLGVPAGWIANGNAVCTVTAEQLNPQIVADGLGGAFATWVDQRSGNNDIWAMQINSAGGAVLGWPANGFPISRATGSQEFPRLVSDGQGGAIAAWTDGRVAEPDIYAMHLYGPATRSPTYVPPRVEAFGPLRLTLSPNPVHSMVTIGFELEAPGVVAVEVLDVGGRRIRALGPRTLVAGRHALSWEGRDDQGRAVRSGLYFVRVRAQDVEAVGRLVLIE